MQKSPRPHACSTNAHAQVLVLQYNSQLGDDGATALASLLDEGKLAGMTMLRLEGCGIGDGGATAIVDALNGGGAPELVTLIIGENEFDTAAEDALKAACATRSIEAMASLFDQL